MSEKNRQRFYYCPKCGGKLEYQELNSKARLRCLACSYVFYENPVVGVAGILLDQQGRILLGRRLSKRYTGLWCIPCGYLEYDEDLYDGLRREFQEETGLKVEVRQVFAALSNFHEPENHSVGIWFVVEAVGGELQAADDLDQLAFFALESIPPLAFPTDKTVIAMLLAGQEQNRRD